MEIIIDGAGGFRPAKETNDAFAVMVEICEYLRDHGRGILSVRLNGEAVTPDGLLSRLKGRPVSDILTIEIESAEIQRLVTEALAELQDAVVKLPELCRQLAELFQSETPEQAYEPFHKLAEIWGAVKARELQVAQALSLDLELAELKGVRFDEHHQELNQYLGEAAQAIESGDCVLLGDLLEYELAPRAEVEGDIVTWLRSQAETRT